MHSTYLPVWFWVLGSHQERYTKDRRPRPMVFAKVVRNQMVPSRAEWRGETDNRATTPVGSCPSTASFSVRPYCKNATRDRCQEYHNCFPFGELEETTRTSGFTTALELLRGIGFDQFSETKNSFLLLLRTWILQLNVSAWTLKTELDVRRSATILRCVIYLIITLWRASFRVPGCQKLQMSA